MNKKLNYTAKARKTFPPIPANTSGQKHKKNRNVYVGTNRS